MLMLKIVQISTLDRYGEFIRKMSTDFPEAWHLVADGDDKGRSEEWHQAFARHVGYTEICLTPWRVGLV